MFLHPYISRELAGSGNTKCWPRLTASAWPGSCAPRPGQPGPTSGPGSAAAMPCAQSPGRAGCRLLSRRRPASFPETVRRSSSQVSPIQRSRARRTVGCGPERHRRLAPGQIDALVAALAAQIAGHADELAAAAIAERASAGRPTRAARTGSPASAGPVADRDSGPYNAIPQQNSRERIRPLNRLPRRG